ncbi:MAG: ECF transporter S component [Lachnospiraceae bacterium]|nr:ECF transporter S component [Lachnospiraceae bacterium]
MSNLMNEIVTNGIFVLECLALIAGIFIVARFIEKWEMKRNGVVEPIFTTKKITMIGIFSAIAAILMIFEFPLPFAPGFYKLDFSEVPVMIAAFAFGPVAGVMVEFCKIVLNLLMDSTTTAFVGELANFCVGCSYVLPASIIYLYRKNRKSAIVASVAGTLILTIFGSAFNAIYLLPKFAELYGMPMEALVGMGTAVNPAITDVTTLVLFAVAPLNIIKGTSVSVITMVVYKKLSKLIKASQEERGSIGNKKLV